MSSLTAISLVKNYQGADGHDLEVLDGASLELRAGENAAILGPSGSGKSTLLAILGTLDRPTSGSLSIAGIDPLELAEAKLAEFRNQRIGFVFQDHHLLPQCTVLENVLIPYLANSSAQRAEVDQARRLIERVGLGNREHHRPAQLSGGERQRVAIARAVVRNPLLVLADEPTGNLDSKTAAEISRLLLELQAEQNSMLLVVTHSESFAAAMQRRMRLEAGRLIDIK